MTRICTKQLKMITSLFDQLAVCLRRPGCMANGEDPDQTASSGTDMPVQNFKTKYDVTYSQSS